MAGRRWAQGPAPGAPQDKARPRPSERGTGAAKDATAKSVAGKATGAKPGPTANPSATPRQAKRSDAQRKMSRTVTAEGKPLKPSKEAMDAARALLNPPKAPWHPLPLAEIGIVIGMIAMLVAVGLKNAVGASAGFTLILICTVEFSWREHRHGYRSHAAILGGTIALVVGVLAWRFLGITRPVALGIAFVVFLLGWGSFDRTYVPARQRRAAEAEGEGSGADGA